MKNKLRHIIILIVLLFAMSYNSFGQSCSEEGYSPCGPNHQCIPSDQCQGGPNPPPPGLVVPIDNHLSLLLAAGICLGVYFFVSSGRKSPSVD